MHNVYPISRHTLLRFLNLFVKKIEGIEHIPKNGPYIIACKHTAPLDGEIIGAAIVPKINRKIHFITNVAKLGPLWEKMIAERWAGCITFDREQRGRCLEVAAEHLRQGKVVGIFPSGLLEEQQALNDYSGKTGVARLALWSRAPVIPIGIRNFHYLSLRTMIWKHLTHPHTMVIRIGKPMTFPDAYSKETTYPLLRDMTKSIMSTLDALSN